MSICSLGEGKFFPLLSRVFLLSLSIKLRYKHEKILFDTNLIYLVQVLHSIAGFKGNEDPKMELELNIYTLN